MKKPSRRKILTAGLGAAAGASGLTGVARLADRHGLLPPDHSGFYGLGESLTYASHRLLTRGSLAREFSREQISRTPFAKGKPPDDEDFLRSRAGGFADWPLVVDGLVARPAAFSLGEIKAGPASSQITELICEEGWSYIAEWIGTPLSYILDRVGVLPEARYVLYFSLGTRRAHSIDMADARHPQTLLTYGMNGGELPVGHGGPLRMRVARQLGYKNRKYLNKLTLTDRLDESFSNRRYSWYAGI